MSAPHQILLYWRERGEAFLARATQHALANHPGLQVVQRHPGFFGYDGCEPSAAIVYVESYFAGVVADYRDRNVPVFTELEIGVADDELKDQGQGSGLADERDERQGGLAAEVEGAPRAQEQVTPITKGRRRKVA